MPRREASVLSAFPFPWKGSGSFLYRGGKGANFPEGCVEGFRVFFCSKGTEFFFYGVDLSELEGWPFPEPRFFPHPQEKLPNLKGANLFLVPADLLLIDDYSEIEPIHSFSFFMEGIQPFSCFIEGMEIGRDRGFRFFFFMEGMDSP